nr:LamG-like jellyroll fold domain-containing protein [Allomuricauda sp.]
MKIKYTLTLILLSIGLSSWAQSSFTAYYTKVTKGESWEAASRTGKYADLIVRLDENTRLVFWRGNSYLPYLETNNGTWNVPEVVPRSGDGSANFPDKVNTFSHVRLISVDQEKAVVHWRYLPSFGAGNPKVNVDHRSIVDEVFTVFPDGTVNRTIKRGDVSYVNWEDPQNITTQSFTLNPTGISNVSTSIGSPMGSPGPVAGNPVIGTNVITPSAWWNFDEAQNNIITETASGYNHTLEGNKMNWKKGISGTAFALDGYNNYITLPNANAPSISDAITIEGWIALGALPWIDQAIVHKGNAVINDEVADDSYGLYVDEFGDIFGRIVQGSTVTYIFGGPTLPLQKWVHVAMVINTSAGTAKTYINGAVVGNETIANTPLATSTSDVSIGSGIADAGWHFTLDALMDEFKIYNSALTDAQILQTYNNFNPGSTIIDNVDMETRVVPEGTSSGSFGARYENLKFYDTWDQLFRNGPYSDIVVEYDNSPVKTVFWKGASYSPYHSNGAKTRFNSEFNENFGANDECCYEPMSDKQHMYSHARIIENTPARVVVHWRYPQIFPDKSINHFNAASGWGDWSDWYMYCYPDGINAYEMIWWATDNTQRVEWAEPMLLLGPGEMPLDILPSDLKKVVTNYNQSSKINWDWSFDWNTLDLLHNSGPKPEIQTINITGSDYKPTMVYDTPNLEFFGPYNDFNRYNHWPVGQKPTAGSDDYSAGGSRTGHTAMLKPIPDEDGYQMGSIAGGGWKKNIRLEGMSNRDDASLRRLYRSWQNAPTLSNTNNVTGSYILEQRAYQLTASNSSLSFTADASTERPLDNPCFVIKNWSSNDPVTIVANGTVLSNLKQGTFTDTDGTTTLIIYLNMVATSSTNFSIINSPEGAYNYTITTKEETCSGKSNGSVTVGSHQTGSFIAKINGAEHQFTTNLEITDLAPNTYTLCISHIDDPVSSERCYEVVIREGISLSGKSNVITKAGGAQSQMDLEITGGTGPYTVKINNREIGQYTSSKFTIPVSDQDQVEVTSNRNCEGKLTFTTNLSDTLMLFPNPTENAFTIRTASPSADKVQLEIFTIAGQLIDQGEYELDNKRAKVAIDHLSPGLYLIKASDKDSSKTFKVIKK